jgi:hypothetical protein
MCQHKSTLAAGAALEFSPGTLLFPQQSVSDKLNSRTEIQKLAFKSYTRVCLIIKAIRNS